MDKIISFGSGIRRQPSVGADGELSELVNLVPKNGELVNVRPMEVMKDTPLFGNDYRLLAIHDTLDGRHYIFIGDGSVLKYFYYDDVNKEWRSDSIETLSSCESAAIMGNIVIVATSEGIRYAIWKDNCYHIYDDSIFRIGAEIENTYSVDLNNVVDVVIDVPPASLATGKIEVKGEYCLNVFLGIDSYINDTIEKVLPSDTSINEVFKYVTFGVVALKGYDGEYLSYSNIFSLDPTLADNGLSGIRIKKDSDEGNDDVEAEFHYSLHSHSIVVKHKIPNELMDLVQGVDVFLTLDSPFYDFEKGFSLESPISKTEYQTIKFPVKSNKDIVSSVEGLFYKSLSIEKEELNRKHLLRRVTGVEQSLSMQHGNESVIAKKLFLYNSRLHIVSDKSIFKPSVIDCLAQLWNESEYSEANAYYSDVFDSYAQSGDVYVFDKEATADIIMNVEVGEHTQMIKGTVKYPLPPIISYPSNEAKAMELYIKTPDGRFFYSRMVLAPFLLNEQSVYINNTGDGFKYIQPYSVTIKKEDGKVTTVGKTVRSGWKEVTESIFTAMWDAKDGKEIGHPSRLYYSSVSNPMVIPLTNVLEIGGGEIIGISTSDKALSQGQFGQFPLYAFCTDGIWALEVASDGSYSAKQPISRDVCNNPDSITQIDNAVVFTTAQGLKLIQGSDVVLLSAQMEGFNVDESIYFPSKTEGEVTTKFFAQYDEEGFDDLVMTETRDFREILSTCKIAYDYPNRLLRIFPDGEGKWYVYSLDTREFACEESLDVVNAVVAGYPTPLVQIGTTLYTFGNEVDSNTLRNGLLLTRPIDMGEPFAMKKLHDMRLHYTKYNKGTYVKMVVYVSNDGVNWAVLPSLRKRSFKYYRVALITKMTDNDTLSGMIMRYDLERTNKIR